MENTVRLYTYQEAVHIYKKKQARKKAKRKAIIKRKLIWLLRANWTLLTIVPMIFISKWCFDGSPDYILYMIVYSFLCILCCYGHVKGY
ncbi:hypothetical protein LIP66_01725 [Coprococcus eutactus]|jgi:hypothetical protein|uniref:hypothetical protein n=1 Tax=Coprococcus eutactus TaxID=33043 RepID=UPI00156FC042|nr:hypothetical protein [Coprococcus eutactus]MCB5503361.1 hypothetical protein [Coprococcus eutactus]NSC95184.1 hypothetical protein [Coprococcus eutactus]NSD34256.1 hypothetical protein [Coprococcus eutactus]